MPPPDIHLRKRLRRTSQSGFYRVAPMVAAPLWHYTAAQLNCISKTEIGHFYFCLSKNKNGQEKVF